MSHHQTSDVLDSIADRDSAGFERDCRQPRDDERNAPAHSPSHKPHRLWMTSNFAVVMAAVSRARDRAGLRSVFRQCPYSVGETMLRLEAAALNQGLTVVAELNGAQPVIVLGSSIGGTPVVMERPDSGLDVPLSVGVRERPGGGVEVLLPSAAQDPDTDWDDLPAEAADDIASLPRWVSTALS